MPPVIFPVYRSDGHTLTTMQALSQICMAECIGKKLVGPKPKQRQPSDRYTSIVADVRFPHPQVRS